MSSLPQPLSPSEIDALDAFLSSDATPGTAMALDTLHGYLTAIAIGPTEPALEEWLPRVWSDDGTGAPDFSDSDEKNYIISLMERMLEDIRLELDDPDYAFAPLVVLPSAGDQRQPDGEMWCYGFMQAVALFGEAWAPFITSPTGREMLRPIYLLGADEVSAEDEDLTRTAQQRAKLTVQIPHAIDRIADHFLAARLRSALAGHDEGAGRLPPHAPSERSPTATQIPCPCGSGTPFTECCGGYRILH